ncbi:hypothetical protein BaRGS_00022238, partial [Batillaria attramentaria]
MKATASLTSSALGLTSGALKSDPSTRRLIPPRATAPPPSPGDRWRRKRSHEPAIVSADQ